MCSKQLDIDGNYKEGGGQILRISTAVSSILDIPTHIYNIRAGRPKPGLSAQHKNGVELLSKMSNAEIKRVDIGSTDICYAPKQLQFGKFKSIVKTAGSIALLVQSSLPCALFTGGLCTFELEGGTDVSFAPPIDYTIMLLFPILEKFSANSIKGNLIKRGFFPKGRGKFKFEVEPVKYLTPTTLLDFGNITKVTVLSYVAGSIPLRVAEEMFASAREVLLSLFNDDTPYKKEIKIVKDHNSYGDGSGINIMVETSTGCRLFGSGLGRRNVSPKKVGEECALMLRHSLEKCVCVDEHTQDQLLIFMALAEGTSSIKTHKPSSHTLTGIHIIEQMTRAKFTIEHNQDETCVIHCVGIGFQNKNL